MALTDAAKAEIEARAKAEAEKILKAAQTQRPAFVHPSPVVVEPPATEEFFLTRLFRALATRDEAVAPYEMSVVRKAMGETSNTDGGFLVPAEVATTVVMPLVNKFSIRQLNPIIQPMRGLELLLPKVTGGAEAHYVGENQDATESEDDTGQVRLMARTCIGLVKVSNGLLADSSPAAEQVVRARLASVLGTKETTAFIQGTGGVSPLGIINMPAVQVQDAVAGSTLSFDDVVSLLGVVQNAESDVTGWLTTPGVVNLLRKIKDPETGRYIWQESLTAKDLGTLFGRRVAVTTAAKDATTATTQYLIAANWEEEFVIGDRQSLEFALSSDRAFEKNQTWIRAIARHDCAFLHEEACAVLPVTGVA